MSTSSQRNLSSVFYKISNFLSIYLLRWTCMEISILSLFKRQACVLLKFLIKYVKLHLIMWMYINWNYTAQGQNFQNLLSFFLPNLKINIIQISDNIWITNIFPTYVISRTNKYRLYPFKCIEVEVLWQTLL